jgi:hypothetical protein
LLGLHQPQVGNTVREAAVRFAFVCPRFVLISFV